jgi:hypothetical protein
MLDPGSQSLSGICLNEPMCVCRDGVGKDTDDVRGTLRQLGSWVIDIQESIRLFYFYVSSFLRFVFLFPFLALLGFELRVPLNSPI